MKIGAAKPKCGDEGMPHDDVIIDTNLSPEESELWEGIRARFKGQYVNDTVCLNCERIDRSESRFARQQIQNTPEMRKKRAMVIVAKREKG